MKKFLQLLTYVVLGVSALMTLLFFLNKNGQVGNFLIWAYVLFFAAIALVVILPLFNIASNPQGIKKMLRNLVLLVVVFGGAYLIASGDQTAATAVMKTSPSSAAMRMTETGIYITYALCLIALLAIVGSSVYTAIKNR